MIRTSLTSSATASEIRSAVNCRLSEIRSAVNCRLFGHGPLDRHEVERVIRLNGRCRDQVLIARPHRRGHERALGNVALLASKLLGDVGLHRQQTHPA
jgi:hypothetical protein